jgi:anti-sigma regulatory factor (Ser/Thr protein kinase)
MKRMRTFPAIPQSVPAARRFAVSALSDSPAPTLEAVELMVSELATNCIRHEHSSFQIVILRTPREIRIEVTDSGAGTPTMRSPGPHEPSGRGLQIVDMLSERWGVERELPSGKTVWFTLDVPAARESAADGGSRQRPQDQSAPITGRAPGVHRRQPPSKGPSNAWRECRRHPRTPFVPPALSGLRRRCANHPVALADRPVWSPPRVPADVAS